MNRRTRMAAAAGSVLAVVLLLAVWRTIQIVGIGVAYKAKMVCSGTFVSNRHLSAVLAELQADDLGILRYVDVSLERRTNSVAATAFDIVRRRAIYREGLGCALVLDGLVPPRSPGAHEPIKGDVAQCDGQTDDTSTIGKTTVRGLEGVIARAFSEPDPQRPRRTLAVVVTRGGHIVGERYAAGIGPSTPLLGWSMTKSVMNALVGILVKQGRLRLDGPVPVPEWRRANDARAAITLDHLLRMRAGVEFDENMSSARSDVMRMLLDVGDAAAFATNRSLIAAPGATWQYSSGTTNILARVVRNALHDDSEYLTFPRRALFEPLGMSSAVMETDASGTFVGSSYMYATARDWARFGELYRQNGVCRGEQILPDWWVAYSTSATPGDRTSHYGAHFWLQVPEEYGGPDDHLPARTFHAAGHEAQFVTIVPTRNVVIVRLGRTRYAKAWDQSAFVRDVLAALNRGEP